jgi:hypothetical protein
MTTTYSPTRTSHGASDRDGSQPLEKAAELGRRAADGAKEAVSEAASSVKGEARRMLDQQVDTGAAYLGHAAASLRNAADDLSKNAPPFAGLADMVADRLDTYADAVKGKTAEEVWDSAVDFTRRQPALVFGLASLAGFLAYRTFKNTQPSSQDLETKASAREFHGA